VSEHVLRFHPEFARAILTLYFRHLGKQEPVATAAGSDKKEKRFGSFSR
jgi:hypothetical protein